VNVYYQKGRFPLDCTNSGPEPVTRHAGILDLGRKDLRRIPIVAVSANALQDDVSQAKDAGIKDFVMKPVDLDRLLVALDKWLPIRKQ